MRFDLDRMDDNDNRVFGLMRADPVDPAAVLSVDVQDAALSDAQLAAV